MVYTAETIQLEGSESLFLRAGEAGSDVCILLAVYRSPTGALPAFLRYMGPCSPQTRLMEDFLTLFIIHPHQDMAKQKLNFLIILWLTILGAFTIPVPLIMKSRTIFQFAFPFNQTKSHTKMTPHLNSQKWITKFRDNLSVAIGC